MVISVAKAQVNRVPLIMKLRLFGPRPIDEFRDAIQLFLVLGYEPFQSGAVVKQSRLRFLIYKIDDLSQDRLGGMKKLGVLAGDAFVPVSKRFPFFTVRRRPKDVAFARENEIGMNRKFQICQARFEKLNGAARVDGPKGATRLEFFDVLHAFEIEDRSAPVGDQGAVEIGAEEANS